MSTELLLLLICLAAGVILSVFLLVKIVMEVRKFRKEYKETQKKHVQEFQKEFMAKHKNNE